MFLDRTLPQQGIDRSALWRREMAIAVFFQLICIAVLVTPWQRAYALQLYGAAGSAVRCIAILCIWRGLARYRPQRRAIWLLLLLRCAWSAVYIPIRGAFVSDPLWWALDIAAGTLLYSVVAALLIATRAARPDSSLWIDIAAICSGAAFALFAYLGAPLLAQFGLSALTLLTGVIIPSLDMALIALTLLLAFTWRERNVSLVMLIAAFALVPLADVGVQLAELNKLGMIATHLIPFGAIFTALIALAALHPSMRLIQTQPGQGLESWGAQRAVLIVGAFLVALCGLLIEPSPGRSMPPVLVAGVLATIFLLIVWRVHLAMRALATSRRRIHYLATHDTATGLPNLTALVESDRQMGRGPDRALLLLRMSQLREVGQLWGLAMRDQWITRIGTTLAAVTANVGMLARVGTDQFALLARLENADASALDLVARRMSAAVRGVGATSELSTRQMPVVCAFDIGIASARDTPDASIDSLLRNAESAIAIAHTLGENRIAHFDASIATAEQRRLGLLTSLHGAVEHNEFTLLFQPIVDMSTRAVICHEALLRWHTSELGEIAPSEFIPLAESIDAIESITDWVMDSACAALVAADGLSLPSHGYRLSINISAYSLQRPGLAKRMMAALTRHRLQTSDICLELTERTQMEDPHGELGALRARGFALAIDDFGSGYSNLSMLARITADTIKLDISFVRAIEADPSMRDLCASLLAQVSKQGAKVVAEGIETEAQHDLLLSLGCHYGQGWLYGRPASQFAPAPRALDVG